jgi:hypothetical protein
MLIGCVQTTGSRLLPNCLAIGSLTIVGVIDAMAAEAGSQTEQEPERVEIIGPKDVEGRRESTTAKIVVNHEDTRQIGAHIDGGGGID